ncbi:response regulator [archaeon]|nr:MAG: response regulator [archaeon]
MSSFLAGIEYISQVITEMQVKQRQSSGVLSAADIEDFIQSIAQCITNMGNTNSFMLMTINRCIDYTKASKGLKLVPKFETIDLLEALSLPLNCMKDIQNRVAIQLLAIPRDVCSHVITDKQWLQENVLCLLSNAVKYSDGGHVTVSVEKLVNEIDGSPTSRKARSSIKGRSSIIELKGDVAKSRRRSAENNSVSTVVLAHNANRVQTSRSTSSESRGSGDIILFDDDQAFYLRFEVEDHGIGLSDEMMQTLFSPFKQAQRLAGGTGLGLFSLANRVQALGGKCGVSRRRDGGEGSMFWFTIPYQPDRTASQQGPKRRRSSMSLNHMGSSLSDGQTDLMISSKTINVIGMTTSILVSPIRTLDPILSNNCGNSTHSSSPASDSNAAQVDQQMQPPPPPLPPLNTIGSENGDDTCRSHESGGSGEKSGIAEAPSVMQDQGIAVEEDMKTLQILLVDDSPAILKMASMMLRRHKHSVHTATNGAEAVKRIQENMHSHDNLNDGATTLYYDVVLIDLQMPIMDGLEAMRRIRKLEHSGPKCSNVIIGMSANSDEETTAEAYGAGADAFMTKPFSLDTFYDTYDGVMVLKEGGELLKNTEGVAVAPVVPSPPS